MSIDLVKDALYRAVKAAIPGLHFYPVVDQSRREQYPNLRYVEVDTQDLGIRPGSEVYKIPAGGDDPPFRLWYVLSRKRTRMRLQLRDSLGDGKDEAAHLRIRAQHNAVDRFFAKTRAIDMTTVGGPAPFAELVYIGDRQGYDASAGVFLSEFEIDVDPWRLLDVAGIDTYRADEITVDVTRGRSGDPDRVLVTRVITAP